MCGIDTAALYFEVDAVKVDDWPGNSGGLKISAATFAGHSSLTDEIN
jgi:hypothetical protein